MTRHSETRNPYLDQLDEFPPWLCRVIARRNGHPLSNTEIAEVSGLSLRSIARISPQLSWDGVTCGARCRFLLGCNINPNHLKEHRRYLKRLNLVKIPRLYTGRNKAYVEKILKIVERSSGERNR